MTDNPSPTVDDELVADLTDEATRLSGSSLRNGCPDCGIASNLASKAADRITDLQAALGDAHEALFYIFENTDDEQISRTAKEACDKIGKALSDSTEGETQ